jgi:DNA mismatch endonuclease, patch repair protein
MPKSRLEFWKPKLRANRVRDLRNQRRLTRLGWKFEVVWECELKNLDEVGARLKNFLDTE